jgi:peptidoglycan/LPS O-acetylase OafA/YrhL
VAASLVIYSHSYSLTNTRGSGEFFAKNIGQLTGGAIAVVAFFFMSGLLVNMTFVQRADILFYIKARSLRLLPGLAVSLLITILIIGLWSTRNLWTPTFEVQCCAISLSPICRSFTLTSGFQECSRAIRTTESMDFFGRGPQMPGCMSWWPYLGRWDSYGTAEPSTSPCCFAWKYGYFIQIGFR